MLLELTALPTAAGREHRVHAWIQGWCATREGVQCTEDEAGNLVIERRDAPSPGEVPPLYITAHTDHPAFVIESVEDDGAALKLAFRGGVKDPYFNHAPITCYTAEDRTVRATLTSAGEADPYRPCTATVPEGERERARDLKPGDIARWTLPDAHIDDLHSVGPCLFTHACDDLAALAAALAAFDALLTTPEAAHVRLLFTRGEEVGFVGAIAACTGGTIPRTARLVLLENSRSFDDSPLGGGPIVRVGDRMSVFSPTLTSSFAAIAKEIEDERAETDEPYRWQRKLMPGGACEATAYQAYGYEATCLCLPLGNYHNMAELDRVDDEEPEAIDHARCGQEHVAIADWQGLVDLLVRAGTGLEAPKPVRDRLEKLYKERSGVLTERF